MLSNLFCWVYNQWLSKAVNDKTDPLVRLLDFVAGSECKYCMAVRCLLIGVGVALPVGGGWCILAGFASAGVAIVMTVGERRWLCEHAK